MLEGSKQDKTAFIFKLIAFKNKPFFEFEDLVSFFKVVGNKEDPVFFASATMDLNDTAEREMASIIFEMMEKPANSKISQKEFIEFLMKDENHVELFNFLNSNPAKDRRNVKTQRNIYELQKNLDSLEDEINLLTELLLPQDQDVNNLKYFRRVSKTFGNALNNKLARDQNFAQKFSLRIAEFMTRTHNVPRETLSPNQFSNTAPMKFKTFADNQNFRTSEVRESIEKSVKANPKMRTGFRIEQTGEPFETFGSSSQANLEKSQKRNTVAEESDVKKGIISIRRVIEEMRKNIDKIIENQNKAIISNEPIRKEVLNIEENTNKKIVFLNNKNWHIVTSLINGIQKSIAVVSTDGNHIITKFDFKQHNKIQMESLTPNAFVSCKFKDYAPYVFQSIRRHFGITNEQYIRSIGVNTFKSAFFNKLSLMLSENSSGKSGSFFFHTSDGKFMIKTIRQSEFELLMHQLPDYHEHLLSNTNTLLNRFYGLYQLKCYDADQGVVFDLYVVVMNNVFDMEAPELIKHKYDLKGSSFGRLTRDFEVAKGAAKKDLNFLQEEVKLRVKSELRNSLIPQIEKDASFLARHHIIDYSMLVGIISADDDRQTANFHLSASEFSKKKSSKKSNYVESVDGKLHYYVGIIDTLTLFGGKKKSEFVIKRIFEGSGISCVPPDDYSERFIDFMSQAFVSEEHSEILC